MAKKSKKKAEGPLERTHEAMAAADGAVAEAVDPYRETALVKAIGLFSEVGDQPPMRALCGGVILAGLGRADERMIRAGVRMLAAHEAATAAKDFVKKRVDRTRPRSGGSHKPRKGRNTSKEETSFPSGHSAGAAAVARAFAREYPDHRGLAYGAAGAVALAQIPRCAHYPTDVGSGLAIGLAAEALVDWLLEPIAERFSEPADADSFTNEREDELLVDGE